MLTYQQMQNNMELYQFIEFIDKYNRGDMSPDEKRMFSEILEKDSELKLEFIIRKHIKEIITAELDLEDVYNDPQLGDIIKEFAEKKENNDSREKELPNAYIANFEGNSFSKKKKTLKKDNKNQRHLVRNKYYYITSTLLVASIAIILVLSNVTRNISSTTIYNRYYEKFEPINYTFRNSLEKDEKFGLAIEMYNGGKIASAISLFQSLSSSEKYAEEIAFYLPLAYLEEENFKKAALGFEEYLENYTNYRIEASWYLSLSYLRVNNFVEARVHLDDLKKTPTIYQKAAKELIIRLDRVHK